MKRILGLIGLSCSMALLVGCGNSGGGKKAVDGSVEGDGGTKAGPGPTDVSALQKEADETKKLAQDLGTELNGLKNALDGGVNALAKRVASLENPTVPTPLDGIALAQAGILDLVKAACNYEGSCCSADELTLKYGPTIQSAQNCIDTFNDLVAKGVNPDFLESNVPVVRYVVSLAQALSSSEIKVILNKKAITACTDWLKKRDCAKYVAPTDTSGETVPHCTPLADVVVNPCEVAQLITGMQGKGEVCGVVYGVDGCKDGLVCRSSQGESGRGICTDPQTDGSRCLNDGECGGDLFCNLAKGTCQARGGEGDKCEYLDPTFTYSGLSGIGQALTSGLQQSGLAIECKAGLQCDPSTKKCVKYCGEGSLCTPSPSGTAQCPDGLVCNVTEVSSLYTNTPPAASYNLGICRAPGAAGDSCTLNSECDSGNCKPVTGGNACGDPKKKVGDTCSTAGSDASCTTGWCGTDLKCVSTCQVYDTMTAQYSTCADGFYCDTNHQATGGGNPCEPLIDSGSDCNPYGLGGDLHAFCKSGFCNTTPVTGHQYGTCENRVAAGTACASGLPQQCPTGQWCNTSKMCADVTGTDQDCTTNAQSCGVGSYCHTDSTANPVTHKCKVTGGEGDACPVVGQSSDPQCKSPSVCASDNKCHANGKYPDGVTCSGSGSDLQCLNGWCSGAATVPFVCATPIAEGKDCATDDPRTNRCDKDLYCDHPVDKTSGKCKAQHTTGQSCEARYGGTDCLNHTRTSNPSACVLSAGVFVCNQGALAPETAFCDGK